MRKIFFILFLLPCLAPAETLRRAYDKPATTALKLSKDIYRVDQVRSTCERPVNCRTESVPVSHEYCENQGSYQWVCRTDYVCGYEGDIYTCRNQETCGYEWVNQNTCETRWENVDQQVCDAEKYDCVKDVKVLDRTWSVKVKPVFDARATLAKGKDEKIEVGLDGDEREPKLTVKVLRSPFKYTTDYKFSSPPNEANLEFRLAH